MAMIHCKECGEEISSSAKKCTKCGKDNRNFFKKHPILTGIIVFFVIGIIGAGMSNSENSSNNSNVNSGNDVSNSNAIESSSNIEETIEYLSLDIDQLENALENNAALACDTYKDKYVSITGRLGTIDSKLKYISLLSISNEWDIIGVHCTLKNEESKNFVKTLSKDDTIIVKGKITDVGEVLGYYLDVIEITK